MLELSMSAINTGKAGSADIKSGAISRSGGISCLHFFMILSALCLFLICTSACTFSRQPDHPDPAASGKYISCRPLKKEADGQSVLKCYFGFEQSSLFTSTGRKVSIRAESGEQLELWWLVDWIEGGKWFPRLAYILYYVPPCSRQDENCTKMRIGECHFPEGCNFGQFLAPDNNGNGVPDSFSGITWDSWDYGDDDGVEGYLDHFRHEYNPSNGYYAVTKYLYHYPAACTMPVSPGDNICLIKEPCKPPYKIFKEEKIESRYLGSSGSKERQ